MEMLPEGTYTAHCVNAQLGFSKKGSEQIIATFKISDENFKGREMTWYGSFSDKAMQYTLDAMKNCGFIGDDYSDLGSMTRNEISLVIGHEANPNDGKIYARVKFINAIGRARVTAPMNADQIRAFNAKMKAQSGKVSPGPGKSNPKDEVPF